VAAWAVVAAGVAAPILRRRLPLPRAAVPLVAAAAPIGLCVAVPRTRARDISVCVLQMWAYVSAYKIPHDDPEALEGRVRIDYPIAVDRVLGLGVTPTVRLQRGIGRPGTIRPLERGLVWTHWMWFAVPHGTVLYVLARRRERFERAAVLTYAVFDLGAVVYWVLPTAPPWYAAAEGREAADEPAVRRMMVEYGEQFWRDGWTPLYSVFGGNPLAAMPSLHFATSVMAAHLLGDVDRVAGAVGWSYAAALGFALVYLGEHYVVDLLAGLALTEAVRTHGHHAVPALIAASRAIAWLETRANAA
jgi:PAP2 superfamily